MSLTIQNCTFSFQCPMKWADLRRDPHDAKIRFCENCSQPVFRCEDDYELNRHLDVGHCVAIERDLEDDPRLSGMVVGYARVPLYEHLRVVPKDE
jgi:hypothetical protein